MAGKLIIFSAPSGSGKSTIINYLLKQDLHLRFSISATSRAPRGTEKNGVEYYFLTPEEFRSRIANGDFLEYEEVYTDKYYGTLKSEVERIFTVPLKVLLEQKPRRGSVQLADHPGDDFPFDLVPQRKRGWRMNKSYYVYFYLYEDKVIWGLTARMLYAFLYRSRKELTEYLAEEID